MTTGIIIILAVVVVLLLGVVFFQRGKIKLLEEENEKLEKKTRMSGTLFRPL